MSELASIPERFSAWAARGHGAPKLAAAYGVSGGVALASAPALGSFFWLPSWVGVAHLVLAYAYAFNRPGVFGKRDDGSQSPWSVVVLFPYLLFVWSFFRLKRIGLRREPCWHLVAEGLYLGRRPCAGELPDDCSLVVDLTAEFPADPAVAGARRYRALPTLNRHVPSDAEFVALMEELRALDGCGMYLHCGAGRGRSAMVAAALLVMRGQARDAAEAGARLAGMRPGVHLHPAQKAIIDRCCRNPRPAAAPQSLERCAESKSAWSAPPESRARSKR